MYINKENILPFNDFFINICVYVSVFEWWFNTVNIDQWIIMSSCRWVSFALLVIVSCEWIRERNIEQFMRSKDLCSFLFSLFLVSIIVIKQQCQKEGKHDRWLTSLSLPRSLARSLALILSLSLSLLVFSRLFFSVCYSQYCW